MSASIHVAKLRHEFAPGASILDAVSLSASPGAFLSLVGPSGCGKSTLLRLLAGLLEPTSGELRVEANKAPPRTAFVFQDPTLLPWRTAYENVALPLELAGLRGRALVSGALKMVGLSGDDQRKFPRELSGGMRMRVSLARALVTTPDLLLLDEPFAALDDLLRQQLNEELSRLWQAQRWTAVFVTHNVSEAVFLSERVLVMSPRPGTIVADVEVPFPYPRSAALRAEPEFARLVGSLSATLRGAPDPLATSGAHTQS